MSAPYRPWRSSASFGAPALAATATALLLFGLYWWTLAPSISELHDNVDSAELVAVAHVSGVAHPPGARVETADDADTFSLWYAQVVLGVRPDVTIEDVRGLAPVVGGE